MKGTCKLSSIFIYPIKSLRGIQVKQAFVKEKGLQYDRRWMLVDENGRFLSQRSLSAMSQIYTDIASDGIEIKTTLKRIDTLTIPFVHLDKKRRRVEVWDDELEASLMGKDYDKWFSEVLGLSCHLVHMDRSANRFIPKKYSTRGQKVSFADGFPYLLCNEASLSELNEKLETPVSMERFRPNLVIEGALAGTEDQWTTLEIDGITFRVVKPCARCEIVTIDPNNGKKGKEPLKTLASYRRRDNKVIFGQNLIAEEEGEIHEGAEIRVLN